MRTKFQLLSVCALSLFALAACDGDGGSLDRPLHFELPPEYSGPVLLIEKSDAPKALITRPKEYRFIIPPSGVLHLSDAWVLRRWHTTRASFSDGSPIPVESTSRVGFHDGPTSTRDNRTYYNWFFVGEKTAAKEFFYGRDSDRREKDWLSQHGVR